MNKKNRKKTQKKKKTNSASIESRPLLNESKTKLRIHLYIKAN